ncbi:MAG: spore germination protein [Clostridium sp.]|uniref:spore germination protein n=1 Tax=Butyribacter sp. TaxID=2822465 RepID=UPI002A937F1C|nr:spore germination protein [Clostridium sp.]MDY5181667.1 spore germination protein [Butyribacter sp.]
MSSRIQQNSTDNTGQKKTGIFGSDFKMRQQEISRIFKFDENFDLLHREAEIGGRKVSIYSIDGFLPGDTIEKLMQFFYSIKDEDMPENLADFISRSTPFVDIMEIKTERDFTDNFLAGLTCMMIEGYDGILALDLREYPGRSVEEPEKDKVLRGSRDGFIEALIPNMTLIRRRIRDKNLVFKFARVGRSSRTDIAVAYMCGRVNEKDIKKVMDNINSMDVDSLTMNQESLAEMLFPGKWINPFPKYKYTERPDTAAASLLEGSIVILVDNSPAVMILPTSLFGIVEDANDYYFPPVTGTYLRLTRMLTNILAVFITPLFLLLIENPDWVPSCLEFILIRDDINVAPIFQLLILEFAIDGLKMAAVNTPNMLTTPLSIVAGIVFGDYTVDSGWFNPEIMLYMAFVAVANYTQSNMELTYAVKFHRIILLILTSIFGICGFIAGTVIFAISLLMTHTLLGEGYLYPIIPFDGRCLMRRFFRMSLPAYEKTHR